MTFTVYHQPLQAHAAHAAPAPDAHYSRSMLWKQRWLPLCYCAAQAFHYPYRQSLFPHFSVVEANVRPARTPDQKALQRRIQRRRLSQLSRLASNHLALRYS
jgi:hypothetical protein